MNDAREIVNRLNEKLLHSEYSEHEYFEYLEYVETPVGDIIHYMEKCIWDSVNDCREWIDEDNKEPLENYLLKEILKIKKCYSNAIKSFNNPIKN